MPSCPISSRSSSSDTLGNPYVFDPRIQGRVTISTGGPVSREETPVHPRKRAGDASRRADRGRQSVPHRPGARAIASGSQSPSTTSASAGIGAGYGIAIVPLQLHLGRNHDADAVLVAGQDPLRASVLQKSGDHPRDGQGPRSVIDLATMFDVDWMRGQSAGIYTLKNATPAEIIEELHASSRTEDQGNGLVRFQADQPPERRPGADAEAELLEKWEVGRAPRPSERGGRQLLCLSRGERPSQGSGRAAERRFTAAAPPVRAAEEAEVAPTKGRAHPIATNDRAVRGTPAGLCRRDGDTKAVARPLSSSSFRVIVVAGDLNSRRNSSASGRASFRAARPVTSRCASSPTSVNNKLLIKAPAGTYARSSGILRRIDKPPLQVLINATLAEVTLNDNLQVRRAVLPEEERRQGAALLGFTQRPQHRDRAVGPGPQLHIGSLVEPKVIIDALATETSVRVVSSPSVVVLHNQPATLQVGDEVPVATRQVVERHQPRRSARQRDPVQEHRRDPEGDAAASTPTASSRWISQQEISSVQRGPPAGMRR